MARLLLSFLLLLGLSCHCGAKLARAPRGKASHHCANEKACASLADGHYWPGLNACAGKLKYHNGPLLTQPITVYLIYYGHWGKHSGKPVLEAFIKSLSSTKADHRGPSVRRWWETVARYTDSKGRHVASKVKYGGAISVNEKPGSYRKYLGDTNYRNDDIWSIVRKAINRNKFPLDSNAVYYVLTSKDVHVGSKTDGFCGTSASSYCGWHGQKGLQGRPVNYAFVGDVTLQCPGCGQLGTDFNKTANGFPSVDSLIDTFAHELAETATDPAVTPAFDPNGAQTGYWARNASTYDDVGENGDICANIYTDCAHPNTLKGPRGTYEYNLFGINGLKFLVQPIPDLKTQKCVLQAPPL